MLHIAPPPPPPPPPLPPSPPPPIIIPIVISGCTDSSATNYNSGATIDDGSCACPTVSSAISTPTPILGCTSPVATNFNPAATVDNGSCTLPGSGGGGGGGGGGEWRWGRWRWRKLTNAQCDTPLLPHVGVQPLVFLYLSQIPYTGLDLGPVGTALYWLALIGFALALAYLILFGAVPLASRSLRSLGSRVRGALNVRVTACRQTGRTSFRVEAVTAASRTRTTRSPTHFQRGGRSASRIFIV